MKLSSFSNYQSLFTLFFLIDKFYFTSIYQCPKFSSLVIKIPLSSPSFDSRSQIYKLLLLYYFLTGQKPNVLISYCSIRGSKKKKVNSFSITLRNKSLSRFFSYFMFRQFATTFSSHTFSLHNSFCNWFVHLEQQINDDDYLFQVLKINKSFKYQVIFNSTSKSQKQLRTLLFASKMPC